MNGKKLKYVHGGLVIFWILLWIVAAITGWIQSVAFVSHMSMAALVLGSASAWQAARTEEKEEE
jgi:hypothetical protein